MPLMPVEGAWGMSASTVFRCAELMVLSPGCSAGIADAQAAPFGRSQSVWWILPCAIPYAKPLRTFAGIAWRSLAGEQKPWRYRPPGAPSAGPAIADKAEKQKGGAQR